MARLAWGFRRSDQTQYLTAVEWHHPRVQQHQIATGPLKECTLGNKDLHHPKDRHCLKAEATATKATTMELITTTVATTMSTTTTVEGMPTLFPTAHCGSLRCQTLMLLQRALRWTWLFRLAQWSHREDQQEFQS